MLVSFDVVSLFTNVPIDEAVDTIRKRLRKDVNLEMRTNYHWKGLLSCWSCTSDPPTSATMEGAAMGSSVSAVVANIYMEFFVELALRSAPVRPRLWKRYVDDTCCIVKRNTVEGLLNHLNNIRPLIQFTLELEEDGSLPFLDTHLRRKKDGTLNITVYRKTTHTDRYLNFRSHHPTHVRKGLVRCLYDRARKVTTTPADLRKEEAHLENVLKLNGYPTQFIRVSATPPPRSQLELQGQPDEILPLVMLPYVSGVSEDIRRVCSRHNLRVVFRPGQTLRTMLSRVKDRLPRGKHSKVVYRIPCDCGKSVYQ